MAARLKTALCTRLGLDVPIVQAPMGTLAVPPLAAAVSNAGALGMLGVTWLDRDMVREFIRETRRRTTRPFGVNMVLAWDQHERLAVCLEEGADIVSLTWGDPTPYVAAIHAAGATLLQTVASAAEARQAVAAGADIVVAQGWEAGGHVWGEVATMPLVPCVVDAVRPTPVVAAGGVGDGRGVAAALMLGAQGAVLGTRFCASSEALWPDWAKKQLVAASGDETSRTRVFDAARGLGWPRPYTGRALRNAFADAWDGREEELRASAEAREQFTVGHQAGDPDVAMVWAGEGTDLITAVEPAGDLVTRIMAQAEGLLRSAPRQLDH